MAARPGKRVAIMLDTKGPEIRTGLLKDHKPITLEANQTLEITTDYTFEGDSTKIACSYPKLTSSVQAGSIIYVADGSLTCEVTEVLAVSVTIGSSGLAGLTSLAAPNLTAI